MEMKLTRKVFGATCTLGELELPGKTLYTLEDVVRDMGTNCSGKIYGQTAIPYGRYEVILSFSNRMQKYLPLLLNVPCYDGVRVHGGNNSDQTLGCVLVALQTDWVKTVWNCPGAVGYVCNLLRGVEKKEKSFIEIIKGN